MAVPPCLRRRRRPPVLHGRDEAEECLERTGLLEADLRALVRAGIAVGDPLGRSGGSGPRVLRAVDGRGRDIVLRVLDLPESDRGRMLRRLSDLRSLRHPCLARVREVVVLPDDRAAVTIDLVDGADLSVVLGARGGLTRAETSRLLDDVGSALAVMHAAGVAHGDVSTSNVVITTGGGAVLIDLAGSVLERGTQGWAAPERAGGGPATPASDVYSLGALLRSCAARSASLSARLDRILADVMADDPQARPCARALAARAHELAPPAPIGLPDGARLAAGALRAAAARPTLVAPARRPRRRGPGLRRRLTRAGAIVTAVALAATGAFLALQRGAQEPAPATAWQASSGEHTDGAGAAGTWRHAGVGGPPTAPGVDAELVEAVAALAGARDEALMACDAQALAAISVPGSPAASADASVLAALVSAGERVEGLDTLVSVQARVDPPEDSVAAWPGAVGLRVRRWQGPSTRVGADGERRTVPAQRARVVVLILVPDPWRVAQVLPAE